ncbi:uncharacterized protein LOC121730787 [Aricia agestis]|uniref:uncharacterized protein LOC121730787 n=1 Tax=Aricia agestis TaxID=91739 RepID=UPI001C203D7A|nr:uncharacterized protein LOC121730787 [Aricia agestis]
MDLKGSLVDTNLRIYVSKKAIEFLKTLPNSVELPENIIKVLEDESSDNVKYKPLNSSPNAVQISNKDIENLDKIQNEFANKTCNKETTEASKDKNDSENENDTIVDSNDEKCKGNYLLTSDLDWLYSYMKKKRDNGDKIPYLHELLEGSHIEMPENEIIKRNPDLEARCVKLRAQQEAREYRKMTKGVDNVRMRFPEDSISYQLKQVNRQLIAIGQFIISIFAGFLFGFKGVEWMVGNLDFGFRLLLGVMCALVIALAEIYFLAKKLNEELNIPETVQLGGPVKLSNENNTKAHLD